MNHIQKLDIETTAGLLSLRYVIAGASYYFKRDSLITFMRAYDRRVKTTMLGKLSEIKTVDGCRIPLNRTETIFLWLELVIDRARPADRTDVINAATIMAAQLLAHNFITNGEWIKRCCPLVYREIYAAGT